MFNNDCDAEGGNFFKEWKAKIVMYGAGKIVMLGMMIFSLANISFAKTTCEVKDCMIMINISIAFAGATDAQIGN